jgi:hypothetical protein
MIALAESTVSPGRIWSYGGAFGVVEAFDGRRAEPDVLDNGRGQHAAARRALDEALLDQIGLDDVLERVARLRRGRDGLDADRPAAEIAAIMVR